ncbi:MAG: hypothetical protein KDD83_00960 [Caldilineaceae bacterium]|nr:hypothetical protein [Caldilineaceae bacterium]
MPRRRRRSAARGCLLTSAALLGVLLAAVLPVTGTPAAEPRDTYTVFLPLFPRAAEETTATPTAPATGTPDATATAPPTVTPTPTLVRLWDPRLDARGAVLVEATVTPGQGYWRLVRARWYNVDESQGRHHIFMDTLDAHGARITGVPLLVTWPDGVTTVASQAKPGEEYAADVAMYALAPAYAARPDDGAPADRVDGMGLGDIDDPAHAHHTSYGLVWQWSTAPAPGTLTPVPTVTPSATPTPTPTATATPANTSTPTLTPSATPTTTHLFSRAELADCVPDDRSTRVEGTVFWNGTAADGYAVVFSWQPDGVWSAQPTVSGPAPPGAYTHFIGVAVGDWWVWIVDDQGRRISPMGAFSTDGPGGACNVATVNFYGP